MAHIILPTIHGSVETGISPISKDGMDISHESFVRDFVPGYLSWRCGAGDVFLMLTPPEI